MVGRLVIVHAQQQQVYREEPIVLLSRSTKAALLTEGTFDCDAYTVNTGPTQTKNDGYGDRNR